MVLLWFILNKINYKCCGNLLYGFSFKKPVQYRVSHNDFEIQNVYYLCVLVYKDTC